MASHEPGAATQLDICPVCGCPHSESDSFCSACGTQVTGFVCTNCQHSYEPGNWACPNCSTQMAFDPEWTRQNRGPFKPECGKCGKPNSPNANFCRRCGAILPSLHNASAGGNSRSASGRPSAIESSIRKWQPADKGPLEVHHTGVLFAAAAAFLGILAIILGASWWLVGPVIAAAWVVYDGRTRKTSTVGWAIGTFFILPFVLPFYLAYRPLKSGERREGGTAWNVLRNFAILWTIVMVVAAGAFLVSVSNESNEFQSEAEQIGAGLGLMFGLFGLAALWFFPMLGAVVLGFFLKNSSVETGPTGPLAEEQPPEPVSAPAGNPVAVAGAEVGQPQVADVPESGTNEMDSSLSQANHCAECGEINESNRKYCGGCGARLPDVVCQSCGATNARAHRYCGDCGAHLSLIEEDGER